MSRICSVEPKNDAVSITAPAPTRMPAGLIRNTWPFEVRRPMISDICPPSTRLSTELCADCWMKLTVLDWPMEKVCQLMMELGVEFTVMVLPMVEIFPAPAANCPAVGSCAQAAEPAQARLTAATSTRMRNAAVFDFVRIAVPFARHCAQCRYSVMAPSCLSDPPTRQSRRGLPMMRPQIDNMLLCALRSCQREIGRNFAVCGRYIDICQHVARSRLCAKPPHGPRRPRQWFAAPRQASTKYLICWRPIRSGAPNLRIFLVSARHAVL